MTSKSASPPAPEVSARASAPKVEALFSSAEIASRIDALADAIAAWRTSKEPLALIGVLRGAVPFVADLARALHARKVPLLIDYVSAESYKGTASTGQVALGAPPTISVAGCDMVIVDDILDVEESSEALGKTAGKDAQQGKITFPAVYGLEASRRMAEEECARAHQALEPFGERAARLHELADLIVNRKS